MVKSLVLLLCAVSPLGHMALRNLLTRARRSVGFRGAVPAACNS